MVDRKTIISMVSAIVLSLAVSLVLLITLNKSSSLMFPDYFQWGVATSGYQTEGSIGGRGRTIWDKFCEDPTKCDGENADEASDSYRRYREDIQLVRHLGVKALRFSVSWPRIMTNGKLETLNEAGIRFYNDYIDEVIASNITPVVTLYHWDLPLYLQETYGGWLDEEIISDFKEFARVCFQRFGDRIKSWITIHDPTTTATKGYGEGLHAPGLSGNENKYRAGHTLIKAHAVVYHLYKNDFYHSQGGKIGIILAGEWYEAEDANVKSQLIAANVALQYDIGWFAEPIFGPTNNWPEIMRQQLQTALPILTEEERDFIRNSADHFWLAHCMSHIVTGTASTDSTTEPPHTVRLTWPKSDCDHYIAANGMRKLLRYISVAYDNPEIFVAGNGVMSCQTTTYDDFRSVYMHAYLDSILESVTLDSVNVVGYFYDTLLDSFNWNSGYDGWRGLVKVDFNSKLWLRTTKKSYNDYKKIIQDQNF